MLTRFKTRSQPVEASRDRGKAPSAPSEKGRAAEVGEMVHVICRVPSGVILRLYDPEEIMTRRQAHQSGQPVTALLRPIAEVSLKGAREDARFDIRDNRILGCHGVTRVSRDFWEAWVLQNKESDLLRRNLIFADATRRRARDQASEWAQSPTGFEGLDPNKLPVSSVSADTSMTGG